MQKGKDKGTPSEKDIRENESNVMSQHSHHHNQGDHSSSLIRSPLGSSAAVFNLGSLSFFALASPCSCSLAKTLDSDFYAINSLFTKDIMAGIGSSSAASSSRDAMPSAEEPAPVAGRNPTPAEEEPLPHLVNFALVARPTMP